MLTAKKYVLIRQNRHKHMQNRVISRLVTFELLHNKTNTITWAPSKDSDQHTYGRPLSDAIPKYQDFGPRGFRKQCFMLSPKVISKYTKLFFKEKKTDVSPFLGIKKNHKGNNLENIPARAMVLVHYTSSECTFQMYEVSLIYLKRLSSYKADMK